MMQNGASESEKTISADIQPPPLELAPADADLLRTTTLPFITFHPVPGMRHPKPWDALTRFCLTFQFPVVVIAVIGFSFTWYWWILSIITMEPAAYPEYTPLIQGLLFIGLFLGTTVSEICCSGRLSDYIMMRLTKDNGNARVPEMRLWLSYPAIVITAGMYIKSTSGLNKSDTKIYKVGSILWGVSIDKNCHWMVGQVAFFLCESYSPPGHLIKAHHFQFRRVFRWAIRLSAVISLIAIPCSLRASSLSTQYSSI